MPRRVPLPLDLASGPFLVEGGRGVGLGRGRLAGADLDRPFYGVRSRGEWGRVQQYAPRLRPGDRFSHTTAVELWGAPLPQLGDDVHVTAGPGLTRPRTTGVIGHEGRTGSVTSRRGLPTSDALTAFLEAATLLDLDDLVAVGDYLVLDPRVLDPLDLRPHLTLEVLRAGAARFAGRGAKRARAASALVRPGVESPRETLLRLLLTRAGFPEPTCGYPLYDAEGLIGWFDLAWPQFKVIAEYDGDQHRTSKLQYERDIARFDRAAAIKWNVVRVRDRGMIREPAVTVRRVAAALIGAGWAPRRHRSIQNAPG